jgi:hypothetical protein
MTKNAVAFKFLEEGECIPPGSQWIPFHMFFDVKCDFTRKARFVAGGHWTDAPSQLMYSSVVTRDSVRIAFLVAALNDLEILAADIGNAYLQAPAQGQSLVRITLEKQLLSSAQCMGSSQAARLGMRNLARRYEA